MNEIAQKTVLISGGAGSMGQLVSDYISSRNDFIMTAIHDPNYKGQEYKTYKDLKNIEEGVVFEFSPASVINENIDSLLNTDADLIIGSSGVSSDMLLRLKTITDRKVIVIPNFSIGAAYQKLFSIVLSDNFKSVNITEKHHGKKQDAPSGTALDLANSMPLELNTHEQDGDFYQINNVKNKNIYSLRDDKFLAEQEVDFVNEYESCLLYTSPSPRDS